MSNQIGIILSFLFLSFYISFSNELLNYQKFVSIFNLQANQVAYIVQENGTINEKEYLNAYKFKSIKLTITKDDYFHIYELTIITNYESISELYSFLNKDIVNSYIIFSRRWKTCQNLKHNF